MKILNFQERINFVEDVVNMCNVAINDGEEEIYHPAMFDIAFITNVLKYFCDVDFSEINVDDLCEFCYECFDNPNCELATVWYSDQIDSLREACKELIDRNHKEYLTVALLNKKDRVDELVDFIEKWLEDVGDKLKEVDVKKLITTANKMASVANNTQKKNNVALKVVKGKKSFSEENEE